MQKLHSYIYMYAYKSTAAFASALFTEQTAKALLICLKVRVTAFVSVVSRFLSHSLFNTN